MNPKKNRIQSIVYIFTPKSTKMAVAAAFLSVLSVFALVIAICPAWYEVLPDYSQLITGITTFSGYNKEADMRIVKVVLWGIPVLFFLFCGLLHFLLNVAGMEKKELAAAAGVYVLWIVSVINQQSGSLFYGALLLLFLISYSILQCRGETIKGQMVKLGITGLLIYAAMGSLIGVFFSLFNNIFEISEEWVSGIPFIVAYLWTIVNAVRMRKNDGFLERQIAFWQIVIPVGLIPMAMFRYVYETTGETFVLFYSSRYKYGVYAVALLFIFYGIYAFFKRKKGIYITTVIAAAMLRTFIRPEGILNIDFFHIGEMSTPFMQLQEYGKVPFFDLMPIHGLCDYFYSVIDYVFLDNTYLSMNGAITIGNMILAAFLSVIIYFFCDQKEGAYLLAYCFVPFMVNDAGIRYIFLFVSFFVLFSKKIREKPLSYVWWYVVLSIISITWNMSIGGAGAAAFFPLVLFGYLKGAWKALKELFGQEERKKRNRFIAAYGFLMIFGIWYVPTFLRIINYLRENTGTTLMANGMAMIEEFDFYKEYLTPGIYTGEQISFLHVFGFLVPFLCCLVMAFHKKNEQIKRDGREYGVIYFVCFYIIANYAFVRFDSGLRTGVLSVFFLFAFLLGMQKWKRPEFWLLLFLGVFMTGNPMDIEVAALSDAGRVEAYVETTIQGQQVQDPVVYVTGDSVGMKRLGNGFIRGNTLQNLQNLKYVFDAEVGDGREYLDLTNSVANYIFLDGSMVLPYTSGYNISNEEMQKSAIAQLEKNPVDLVILAPYIRFDEATISLRSPVLYEYLYEAGYKPYVYENVIYMKKSKSLLFEESNGFTDFANLMHKQALQMLPAVWGGSEAIKSLHKIEIPTDITCSENTVTWHLQEEKGGEDIDFVKITLPDSPNEQSGSLADGSEQEIHFVFGKDKKEFTFYKEGNSFLIPVYSSPFWKSMTNVECFSLEVKEGNEDMLLFMKDASVSFLNF